MTPLAPEVVPLVNIMMATSSGPPQASHTGAKPWACGKPKPFSQLVATTVSEGRTGRLWRHGSNSSPMTSAFKSAARAMEATSGSRYLVGMGTQVQPAFEMA